MEDSLEGSVIYCSFARSCEGLRHSFVSPLHELANQMHVGPICSEDARLV